MSVATLRLEIKAAEPASESFPGKSLKFLISRIIFHVTQFRFMLGWVANVFFSFNLIPNLCHLGEVICVDFAIARVIDFDSGRKNFDDPFTRRVYTSGINRHILMIKAAPRV